MINISLLYGPPASGKTTTAQIFCDNYNYEYISVGQIARREMISNTKIGKKIKKYLDDVVEYPTEFITTIVNKELDKMCDGANVILDGFPKYENEAKSFLNILESSDYRLEKIIIFELTFSEITKRARGRVMCPQCSKEFNFYHENISICKSCKKELIKREDDDHVFLKRRFDDFERSLNRTLFVMSNKKARIIKIDASQKKEEVLQSFKKCLV